MARRRVQTNLPFNIKYAALDPSDEEIEAVNACLHDLEELPESGVKFTYSGYAGDHWVIECGRFVIVYQFSKREVRPKDIQLGERWHDASRD